MGTLIRLPRNIAAAMGTCRVTPKEIIRITDEINTSIPVARATGANTETTPNACSNLLCDRDEIDRTNRVRTESYCTPTTRGIVLSNRVRVLAEDVAVALWITSIL